MYILLFIEVGTFLREKTTTEQRGRIPSLAPLTTLLGMQPRVWLAFRAVSARSWVILSLSALSLKSWHLGMQRSFLCVPFTWFDTVLFLGDQGPFYGALPCRGFSPQTPVDIDVPVVPVNLVCCASSSGSIYTICLYAFAGFRHLWNMHAISVVFFQNN